MNFGNHRYTNEQNRILFICKCDIKYICAASPRKFFFAPAPNSKTVPTALKYRKSWIKLNILRYIEYTHIQIMFLNMEND